MTDSELVSEYSEVEKVISDEVIKELRDGVEGKELIVDTVLESLVKQRDLVSTNDVELAKLFVRSYDLLLDNIGRFGEFKDDLYDYLATQDVADVRKLLREFGSGLDIGDYHTRVRIGRVIDVRRDNLLGLISTFFKIFGEED